MITLISATPGSGKTLWAVKEIFARVNEAEPWNIFSNIDGLKLDTAQPLKDSFEDYPPRSLVVIDEAQRIKHFNKNYKHPVKNEMHPEVQFLETHRHADHLDIIFITQAPRRLHADVLDMVGMHYHLHRPMGMKMATWWLWRHHQLNPNTKSIKADAEDSGTFTYPKHLFDMYKSSDGGDDSHSKIKIPMKIVNAVWMLCLVLGVTAYLYMSSRPADKEETVKNESEQTIEKTIPSTTNAANSQTAAQADESLDVFCRKGANVEKPECVKWFNELSKSNGSVKSTDRMQTVAYNPNSPFDDADIVQNLSYEVSAKPVFSGCTHFNGQYTAYTQQGTRLKVSASDCKRLISDADRPFNYFAKEQPNKEPTKPETDKDEESSEYKKAFRENRARIDAEKMYLAQHAQVKPEPFDTNHVETKYLDSANRY